jgi:hypothetical protein
MVGLAWEERKSLVSGKHYTSFALKSVKISSFKSTINRLLGYLHTKLANGYIYYYNFLCLFFLFSLHFYCNASLKVDILPYPIALDTPSILETYLTIFSLSTTKANNNYLCYLCYL